VLPRRSERGICLVAKSLRSIAGILAKMVIATLEKCSTYVWESSAKNAKDYVGHELGSFGNHERICNFSHIQVDTQHHSRLGRLIEATAENFVDISL
jgi:hypothetical protein